MIREWKEAEKSTGLITYTRYNLNEHKFQFHCLILGTIIRRHRVQRPNGNQFYTIEDFNLGNELSMYARVFKICDCDEFTRNFLKKTGVRINDPVKLPGDPYNNGRKAVRK